MRETIKNIANDINNYRYKKGKFFSSLLEKNQLYCYQLYKNDIFIKLGQNITTTKIKLMISWVSVDLEDDEMAYFVEKINEMGRKLLEKYKGNVNMVIQNRLLETATKEEVKNDN